MIHHIPVMIGVFKVALEPWSWVDINSLFIALISSACLVYRFFNSNIGSLTETRGGGKYGRWLPIFATWSAAVSCVPLYLHIVGYVRLTMSQTGIDYKT